MANPGENVPAGQKFYNNLILLFLLSNIIMLISYTGWGLYEIITQPTLP